MFELRVVFLAIAAAAAVQACETIDPPLLHIRLLTPLASDSSRKGSQFTTIVTAPLLHCGDVLIPVGSLVSGTVRRASRVGLGLIHERAALELDFTTYESPDAGTYRLSAQLVNVDNAREEVTSRGQIKGVLAASNANRFFRGIWYRPTMNLLPHSVMGLTGASGKIWQGFGLGPQGAAGLFAARILLFRFPEPEIILPAGTDMHVRVNSLPEDIPSYPVPPISEVPDALAEWLIDQPFVVTKADETQAEDIVNFAFLGTQAQILQAFEKAGWDPADSLSSRTFSRTYSAYTTIGAYATAPVSKLYYRGAIPDLVFQKSLNTVNKRHHIRVWYAGSFDDAEVWLGAATHDIEGTLKKTSFRSTHKIDRQIDLERGKIVEDLTFTDCVEAPGYVDRLHTVRPPRNNESIFTDGRLAVLALTDCEPAADEPVAPKRPGRKLPKLARRVILEARQYLLRDNVYYYGFQGVKKIIQSRGSSEPDDLTAGVKPAKLKTGQIKTSFSWTSPVTSAVSSPTNTFSSDLIPNSGR